MCVTVGQDGSLSMVIEWSSQQLHELLQEKNRLGKQHQQQQQTIVLMMIHEVQCALFEMYVGKIHGL